MPATFAINETIFFVRDKDGLKQVVEATIDNPSAAARGKMRVEMPGGTFEVDLKTITQGRNTRQIRIPEVSRPTPIRFTLSIGKKRTSHAATINPQRHWSVYLTPSVHTDFGYNDVQLKLSRLHNNNLDKVIEYCKYTVRWPAGSRYKWNCENTWQVENFVRNRSAAQVKEFLRLIRKGDIEVGGYYAHTLSEMCSHEELIRLFYPAQRLRNEYDIEIDTAILTDLPGYTWSMASVLARSGIKYMAIAINNCWGPFHRHTELETPFYWIGPDGERVLVWHMRDYAYGDLMGFDGSFEQVYERLPKLLEAQWNTTSYPHDLVMLHGAHGDNQIVRDMRAAEIVRKWNQQWTYPKIMLATNREFFQALEKTCAGRIPEARGDWGTNWGDGAASAAAETAVNRQTHEVLGMAEKFAALNHLFRVTDYPDDELKDAYEQMIFFDDATWGTDYSIIQPHSARTKALWAAKSSYGYDAAVIADCALEKNLLYLSSRLATDRDLLTVVVWNGLSWERTDVVQVKIPRQLLPRGKGLRVVDNVSGESVPCQVIGSGRKDCEIIFVANDVPGTGYRTYSVHSGDDNAAVQATESDRDNELANRFYRIRIDPVTGGIGSIFDKELRKELVDKRSPYKLNQYIYDKGTPPGRFLDFKEFNFGGRLPNPWGPRNHERFTSRCLKISEAQAGPVRQSIIVRAQGEGCSKIEQEIILYNDLKRIDIVNRLNKKERLAKEGVYYAYPFAVKGGDFKCDLPNAVISPATDQLSGAGRDCPAIQHWVDVSNADFGVTWATREAPTVEFCGINSGRWLRELKITNSTLFSYIMNNYWWTNYKASQGGELCFSYAVTSHAGGYQPVAATRFGWGYACPLQATLLAAGKPVFSGRHTGGDIVRMMKEFDAGEIGKRFLSKPGHGFFEIDKPNAVILAIKRAEDGQGHIIRLLEIEGQDTVVQLRLHDFKISKAYLTSLLESNMRVLKSKGNTIDVPLPGNGFATIRVETAVSNPV